MELLYGAGKVDRLVADAEALLRDWRERERDHGQLYLEFEPVTPRDRVLVEDLAATMLINSRVAAPAATSVYCGLPAELYSGQKPRAVGLRARGEACSHVGRLRGPSGTPRIGSPREP